MKSESEIDKKVKMKVKGASFGKKVVREGKY